MRLEYVSLNAGLKPEALSGPEIVLASIESCTPTQPQQLNRTRKMSIYALTQTEAHETQLYLKCAAASYEHFGQENVHGS